MSTPLEDWPRPYIAAGGEKPFLFYVVFGCDTDELELSRSRHRCDAIPDDIEIHNYGPGVHPEVLDEFRQGYLWDELLRNDPVLAEAVAKQTRCTIVRGPVADDSTLNYFRNTIGLLTCLLDCGGVAIYDPQSLKWWSAETWRTAVFEPAAALPREHVVILVSDDAPGVQWLHTRGMRKFGRPDLSIHGVGADQLDAVLELLNRFIEFQAFGGVIPEGQEIRSKTLPSGMVCTHGGDLDDPDFNNVHVEIHWPTSA
jgi:hypothetical protein